MNHSHWNNKQDLLSIVKRLVKVASISGTNGENKMVKEIRDILSDIPYYSQLPEYIIEEEIKGDTLGRSAIAALYKSSKNTDKTIVLLSHYDVVDIEDYGHLKEYAFFPDEYTSLLKNEEIPSDAKEDLQSGDWLFARGIMDMKAGLALHIGLISETSMAGWDGNIVLLSVPDEERNSEGMFAGVELLTSLKDKHGLNYEVCICSEPNFASYPGDRNKYVYLGSVGKLLPLVYCKGKETHVGEPLEGVNASWMASSFTNEMELNELFIEEKYGEKVSLPTCLKLEDLKQLYNVQTPTSAYVLYNVLTLTQSPEQILEKITQVARDSSNLIHGRIQKAYRKMGNENAMDISRLKPKVFTYSELYAIGVERYGDQFVSEVKSILEKETDPQFDLRKLTVSIAEGISQFCNDLAPFYLVMLAPPYYPHVSLTKGDKREQRIKDLSTSIIEFAQNEFNEELKLLYYFAGLSDVSYCRLVGGEGTIATLENEMPLYGKKYLLPLEKIESLDIPTINLGPFGKDAHKRTERLHIPYSFEIAPMLLKQAVKQVFEE
ncbi:M20/M25/M40 family metallo-hydrolase [Peribacillus alkalitolerans]|uniref:M20/M25/M40 family metallo-hydrolase n=1 Tax=Peribacillus alkalitolerans TaxID=1550385 RepID=UPI0013D750E3|nr:M20/M25/M40 family metallo-hydrolase [Peribacillus alkalitolerans]